MAAEQHSPAPNDDDQVKEGRIGLDREDESQDFVDKSKLDFDPDDGIYSGTAVDGSSEIPGPHLDHDDPEQSAEDLHRQAEDQAKEAGADPAETPAAKSPVAKAAEQAREQGDAPDGEG
jgi:hypothetical protein